MGFPLAILTPNIGLRSETFIRRHIEDLMPGGAVVATRTSGQENSNWSVSSPVVSLDRCSITDRLLIRLLRQNVRSIHLRRVIRFFQRHGVEVVLGEYLDFCLPWIEPLRRAGIRFYSHGHGYDVSRRLHDASYRDQYVRELPKADGIITVSEYSRRKLIGLGLRAELIQVIPCGTAVPVEPFDRLDRSTVRCIAVGRMVPKKSPLLTLDAFRQAALGLPHLRLDLVGTGELFPAAQQYIRDHKLEQCVTLHGGRCHDKVRELLQESDIFLQHSVTDPQTGDEEGLPVAILEAMAHALPVISTRHAGIPEAVEEGRTGLLVEEGDSKEMAEHIVKLTEDHRLRRGMGKAGWRRCSELFSWERERAELMRLFGWNSGL